MFFSLPSLLSSLSFLSLLSCLSSVDLHQTFTCPSVVRHQTSILSVTFENQKSGNAHRIRVCRMSPVRHFVRHFRDMFVTKPFHIRDKIVSRLLCKPFVFWNKKTPTRHSISTTSSERASHKIIATLAQKRPILFAPFLPQWHWVKLADSAEFS